MPGGTVLYFAAWKQHYSLYPATPGVVAHSRSQLAPYNISKGTIRFPLSQACPAVDSIPAHRLVPNEGMAPRLRKSPRLGQGKPSRRSNYAPANVSPSQEPRRVPRRRAPDCGLDRRLLARHPPISRLAAGRARRAHRAPARRTARRHGEPIEKILEDFRNADCSRHHALEPPALLRLLLHLRHPARAFSAEMLAAALNVNHMLWKTGPSATELEQVSLGWLRQWLGLPEEFFGIIHDTASTAGLHAVIAAREARAGQPRRPLNGAVHLRARQSLGRPRRAGRGHRPRQHPPHRRRRRIPHAARTR